MATETVTPPPCNPFIFRNGECVCVLDGRPHDVELWVKAVAKKANALVDWHYFGGRANVLHLGDSQSLRRVLSAIEELKAELRGVVLYTTEL